jgi:hypothetical protein
MNELFRAEALEHRRRRRPGELLHPAPRWTAWGFWVLLVMLAAAIAAAATVPVGETTLMELLLGSGGG